MIIYKWVTPITQNVRTKVLGTATFSKNEHFTSLSDNVIAYIDQVSADFTAFYSLVVSGGAQDTLLIEILKFDDLTTTTNFTVVAEQRRFIPNLVGGLDQVLFVIPVPDITLNFEERIEIHVTNETDGTDITLANGSTAFVRPS